MIKIDRAHPYMVQRANVEAGWVFTHLNDDGKLKANRFLSFGPAFRLATGEHVSVVFKPKDNTTKLSCTSLGDGQVAVVGMGTFRIVEQFDMLKMTKVPAMFSGLKQRLGDMEMMFLGPLLTNQENLLVCVGPDGSLLVVTDKELLTKWRITSRSTLEMVTL